MAGLGDYVNGFCETCSGLGYTQDCSDHAYCAECAKWFCPKHHLHPAHSEADRAKALAIPHPEPASPGDPSMSAKHTPGPWRCGPGDGCAKVQANDGDLCATVYGGNQETDYANARLIAAAPELLEALRACRRAMQNDWTNKPRIGDEAVCARADLAIARASGEDAKGGGGGQ